MIRTKNFIQQQTSVGICVPVQVKIEGAVRGKQTMDCHQALVEKIKISIKIFPVIVVTLSQFPLFRLSRVLPPSDARRVFAIGKKRRIHINEINTSLVLREKRMHDR